MKYLLYIDSAGRISYSFHVLLHGNVRSFCLGCHVGCFVFLRWLCLGARGSFEISAARCCCVTSPGSRVGARRLFDAGSALRWKASLRCWFCHVTAFTKSWIRLDSLSQPMLRRESSGPASGSSVRELESDEGEKQESMNKALAPCFKQSDLDPPTGGCSNQSVCVGWSPAYVIGYLIQHERYTQIFYMCCNHTL